MDMLLVAVVPFAGIAIMLVTAFMTLPAAARLSMVASVVTARDSREFRDLEIGMMSFDDAAMDSEDLPHAA